MSNHMNVELPATGEILTLEGVAISPVLPDLLSPGNDNPYTLAHRAPENLSAAPDVSHFALLLLARSAGATVLR